MFKYCISLIYLLLLLQLKIGAPYNLNPTAANFPFSWLNSYFSPPLWQNVVKRLSAWLKIGRLETLRHYNVDRRFTISGLSSGAGITAHLSFSLSDIIKGAGVFCGAPEGIGLIIFSDIRNIFDARSYKEAIDKLEREGKIPSTKNFKTWVGAYVHQGITDPLPVAHNKLAVEMYRYYGVPRVKSVIKKFMATHCIPTAGYLGEKAGPCPLPMQIICACGYCGICDMLSTILPYYRPANLSALPTGRVSRFRQTEFADYGDNQAMGLADFGWLYVPKRCEPETGIKCELHFYMHGCGEAEITLQFGLVSPSMAAYTFAENADANDIIIVAPQVRFSIQNLTFGCWDNFLTSTDFFKDTMATRFGDHPVFVRRIYERITFGR